MNMLNWRKEKILITGGTGLIGTHLTNKECLRFGKICFKVKNISIS